MFSSDNIVAINFSDRSLEALQLKKSGKSLEVLSSSRLRLPKDIIENGKIVNNDLLLKAVKQLLEIAKPSSIKAKGVFFSIPDSKVFIQTFKLPKSLKKEDLDQIIKKKAEEYIPIESEFLVSDFQSYEMGDSLHIVYAGTYKNIVEEYTDLFSKLGIKVSLITVESFGLVQAILDSKQHSPFILADIGARTTNLTVIANGIILDAITINKGGNDITKSVAAEEGLDEIEAESRKIELAQTTGLEGFMIREFSDLVTEIDRFRDYVKNKHAFKIESLLLTGGSSLLPGIDKYLESNLALKTELAKPVSSYKLGPAQEKSPLFLPVLGVASMALHKKDDYLNFIPLYKKDEASKNLKQVAVDEKKVKGVTKVKEKKERKYSAVRLSSLVLTLLGAIGLFSFIWWQSSITNTRPAGISEFVDFKEINLEYQINTNNTFGQSSLPGNQVGLLISGDSVLDSEYWETIYKILSSNNISTEQKGNVYPVVVDNLSRKMWFEKYENLANEYRNSTEYLINRYTSFSLVTSTPSFEEFEVGQEVTMNLTVEYKVLLVDLQAYEKLVNTIYVSKYHEPAPSILDKKVSIELLENGNYKVIENIRFPSDK